MIIENEGFIKVIQRKEIKNYLFYLTYNNRARIIEKEYTETSDTITLKDKTKRIVIKELKKKPPKIKNKFIKSNDIDYTNNLFFYKKYKSALKDEMKGTPGGIESLELIMSYSLDFNDLMKDIYGEEGWQETYEALISKLLEEFFISYKHHISFFHKEASNGYRVHNHTLVYPYKRNQEGMFVPSHVVDKELLEKLKLNFNKIASNLLEKNKQKILKKDNKNYIRYQKLIKDSRSNI